MLIKCHTPVVPTQNVSITKVHMTANAYHHSILLKASVLMTTNVLRIATIVTKVDLPVLMKLRHTQWNGSVVLLHTQPPEPIIASPATVLTKAVMFQVPQNVSITTKVSLVIVHPVSGLKKVESVSMLG